MTAQETNIWGAYRYKYGPLNPVRRYDQGAALIASQITRAHGGKASPNDFMPYGKEPEPEVILEEKDFLEMLKATGRTKVGR